jgi:hypothetical protein
MLDVNAMTLYNWQTLKTQQLQQQQKKRLLLLLLLLPIM